MWPIGTGGGSLQLLQEDQDSGSLGLNPELSKEETGMLNGTASACGALSPGFCGWDRLVLPVAGQGVSGVA